MPFLLQKCYLKYTGKDGKALTTATGRGWSNAGIERYNSFAAYVYSDRKHYGVAFDKAFRTFCHKRHAHLQQKKNDAKPKKGKEDTLGKKLTCISANIMKQEDIKVFKEHREEFNLKQDEMENNDFGLFPHEMNHDSI